MSITGGCGAYGSLAVERALDDLPGSIHDIIARALQPVVIDRPSERGRYDDPNVWMRHPIAVAEFVDRENE